MGFDLKSWERSLDVIKSSSKNPQKGRGKNAPERSFGGPRRGLWRGHIALVVDPGGRNNRRRESNAQ